jgi:hypothetical protein
MLLAGYLETEIEKAKENIAGYEQRRSSEGLEKGEKPKYIVYNGKIYYQKKTKAQQFQVIKLGIH